MQYTKDSPAMSESELAQTANVSIAALRKWRREHKGPRYLKLGRLVRYLARDVDAWMDEHAIDVGRKAGGQDAT